MLIAVAVLTTGFSQYRRARSIPHEGLKLDLRGLPNLPVVIDQALLYTPIMHYNPELQQRLYFVASPEDSLRTINSDTLDINMMSERGWLPVNIADRDAFFHSGGHFLLFADTTEEAGLGTWELAKINEMGGNAREVRRLGEDEYYFDVTIP